MLLLRVGIDDFGGAQSWATMVGLILKIKANRRTDRRVMHMRKPPNVMRLGRTEPALPVRCGRIIEVVGFRSTANETHRARRRDESGIVDEVTGFFFHDHAFNEIDDF